MSAELTPSSASNGGLFSHVNSSERGFPFHGQSGVNAELERRQIERLSKSIRHNLIGFDITCRTLSAQARILEGRGKPSTYDGPSFIIDCYAYRPSKTETIEPVQKEEAIATSIDHINQIDSIGLTNLPREWAVIRGNLNAFVFYMREIERKQTGQPLTNIEEYKRQVVQIEDHLIPWARLDSNLDRIVDILQRMGELEDRDRRDISEEMIRKAVRSRSEKTRLTPNEFQQLFMMAHESNRAGLSRILDTDLTKVRFDFVTTASDEFWMFLESIGIEKDELLFNIHERHAENLDIGYAQMYGGHEPMHFIVGHLMRQKIRNGKIDPAAGLLVMPGPTSFQWEGLAQTVGDLAGFETSIDGKLATEVYRLEKRAIANGLHLLERGERLDEVVKTMRRYMLKTRTEIIRKLLTEGTTKPFERAFLSLYGRSDDALMQLRKKIGEGVRNLLPYWSSTPLTPEQFLNPPLSQLIDYES